LGFIYSTILSEANSIPHTQYVPQIRELQRFNNFYTCMILVKKIELPGKKVMNIFSTRSSEYVISSYVKSASAFK